MEETLFDILMNGAKGDTWWDPITLRDVGVYLSSAVQWGQLTSHAKRQGVNIFQWEMAVREVQSGQGIALPQRKPYIESPSCPQLPAGSMCMKSCVDAAPWLDAYVAHSLRWSPRGMQHAHTAIGLWALSTIAARRVFCAVGPEHVYPSLFIALVARSTLYAKSKTVLIGRQLIQRAGCQFLLTADRTTPQALMRSMSGIVPQSYGSQSEEDQAHTRRRLAFSGQRGSYFEEWGGMLNQMRRTDSPMAEFHTFLRVIDDNQEAYSNDTIQRGIERIPMPYLALLASATPHDLAPFMTPGSAWWHDGFWPRFALITPGEDETPSSMHRERTGYQIPGSLIEPLHTWHTSLGTPGVTVTATLDSKGKPTGTWDADVEPLPQREIAISDGVYDAYEAYNDGLLTIIKRGDIGDDFDSTYGRYHEKALRVALLLASFAGEKTIGIDHWAYAQRITETWRRSLHTLVSRVASDHQLSKEEQAEEKIERYLGRVGVASAREIQRNIRILTSEELTRMLKAMEKIERIVSQKEGHITQYGLLNFPRDIVPMDEKSEIPF
jgi:Protein of unknown function (DUF3987)